MNSGTVKTFCDAVAQLLPALGEYGAQAPDRAQARGRCPGPPAARRRRRHRQRLRSGRTADTDADAKDAATGSGKLTLTPTPGRALALVAASLVGLLPVVAEATLGEVGGQRFSVSHRGGKVQKPPEAQTLIDPRFALAFLLRQLLLRPTRAGGLRQHVLVVGQAMRSYL